MIERLSRYQLGQIKKLHDEAHYRNVTPEDVTRELARIGLHSPCSRFQVAERVRELERGIQKRELAKYQ